MSLHIWGPQEMSEVKPHRRLLSSSLAVTLLPQPFRPKALPFRSSSSDPSALFPTPSSLMAPQLPTRPSYSTWVAVKCLPVWEWWVLDNTQEFVLILLDVTMANYVRKCPCVAG